LLRAGALVAIFGSACTLVNSFDEVKPLVDGTYGPAGPGGAIVTDAATSSDGTVSDASNAPALGAVVVAGQLETAGSLSRSVLTVLDPATGREIGPREPILVAAISYDGLRDLWYIFESKGTDFIPAPQELVVLHVRSLDLATGAWTELGSAVVPPLQSYDSVGVLRDRLVYVAHPSSSGGGAPSGYRVVTIDTSNPSKPAVVNEQTTDRAPLGVVATRSTTGPGGVVNLVRVNTGACATPTQCPVEIVRVLVPNGADPVINPPVEMGKTSRFALPGYATFTGIERDVIVFPRTSNSASAPSTVSLFDPRNQNEQQLAPASFIITDSTLRRAAVSECTQTVFVVGTNGDFDLHAVPVLGDGGGAPARIATGHSGQAVYFEPTTRTVIAPFGQGAGFDYAAFHLGGTADAPVLTKRTTDWTPPTDVRPLLLGIREPVPIVCP
jgi:hypothetical protein